MKFIDLTKLTDQRLKAYRRSILAKIGGYELCDCGSLGCDHKKSESKNNPDYINLRQVRSRVNKELALRQRRENKLTNNPQPVLLHT